MIVEIETKRRACVLWILFSTASAAIGTIIAVYAFSTATLEPKPHRFHEWYPYGLDTYGFVLSVALTFSVAQWFALRKISQMLRLSFKREWLWILATAIGIVAMLLRPVGLETYIFLEAPATFSLFFLTPGLTVLALAQWSYLTWCINAKITWLWVPFTMLGTLLGSSVFWGLASFFLIDSGYYSYSPEWTNIGWATASALGMSSFQSLAIVRMAGRSSFEQHRSNKRVNPIHKS